MRTVTVLEPIKVAAGVQPVSDKTNVLTAHYTYSDKIRFVNGAPKKIGGFDEISFDYSKEIDGTTRSLYSEIINGKYYTLAGTHKKLYSIIGTSLTNITPLETTSTTIANSLDTDYQSLVSNPLSATDGSPLVVITVADGLIYEEGDTIYLSGATAFAGFAIGQLNGDAIVRARTSTTITINVGANATSTATGGGASVVLASGLVTVNATAHGQLDGDRVKIDNAATFGGILNTEINGEFIIRNVTTNTFDVMTIGEATSAVTGGGGASTEYFKQIPIGLLNEGNVLGYGAGLYGTGLYGTGRTSSSARSFPRIWHMDRYGDTIITTAGNQSKVYQWDGSNDTAPEVIANAPTAINYAFISDNILVVLGEGGVENRVTGSNQGDITNWTSSSVNQVFRDDIEGAGRLISHCPVEDYNLLYTENKTYTFRYIGKPLIWEIKPLDESVGLIAPMARVPVNGIAVWMGQDNFYMYRGGTVEVIPSNSQNESTLREYVFDNLNWGQKSKFFAWYNKTFNEVWFHYASAGSNECDRVAVVNMNDFTWYPHLFNRTAAEYPNAKLKNPRMINGGILYQHENGVNAGNSPLEFTLTSNLRFYGKDNANITAIIPDGTTDYNITFDNVGYLYPKSANATYNVSQTVTPTTDRLPIQTSARFHQYTWTGNALNQDWQMGQWFEEVQRGSEQ